MKPSDLSRREFCKLAALAPLAISSISWNSHRLTRRATLTMGSILDVRIFSNDTALAHRAIQSVFEEFRRIDELLSVYRTDSWISKINAHAGRAEVRIPDEVGAILRTAQDYCQRTDGRFNVLVEPLMRLYGFRESAASVSDNKIADAIDAAKPEHLSVSKNFAGLSHPGAAIDLGGIGVGYAIDRSVERLREYGITNALINHAGDIFALGEGPEGNGWPISIQDPLDPRGTVMTLELKDTALSTSGNYEKFVTLGDRSIGHILNPINGKNPTRYLSLSVVADTATEADALSTGYFCDDKIPENVRFLALISQEKAFTILDRL